MSWFGKKKKYIAEEKEYIAEDIPDKDFLFTRIHKINLTRNDGLPKADAFKNTPFNVDSEVLSSDWCKYINAQQCRDSVVNYSKEGKPPKNPKDYFIWKMNVGRIRKELVPAQEVFHTPRKHNRAHSTIKGRKPENEDVNNAEFRSLIIEIGQWAIAP